MAVGCSSTTAALGHGPDACGTGPMAQMLAIKTPDLTGLQTRSDGVFPTFFVVVRIDGRNPLMAHGGEMPVFGEVFEAEDATLKTPAGQPIMTSQPIVDLVAWLEGRQARQGRGPIQGLV